MSNFCTTSYGPFLSLHVARIDRLLRHNSFLFSNTWLSLSLRDSNSVQIVNSTPLVYSFQYFFLFCKLYFCFFCQSEVNKWNYDRFHTILQIEVQQNSFKWNCFLDFEPCVKNLDFLFVAKILSLCYVVSEDFSQAIFFYYIIIF